MAPRRFAFRSVAVDSGELAERTTHYLAPGKRAWPATSRFHRYWTGVW